MLDFRTDPCTIIHRYSKKYCWYHERFDSLELSQERSIIPFFSNTFSVLALHNVIWHAIKYTCAFVPRFGSSWSPCPGTDSLPFWSSVSFPTTVRLIPYFLRNRVYLRCGCNVELKIKAVSSLRCAFSSSHYIVYTMASYRRIDHNNITAELGACIGNSSLVRRIHVNTHFG